MEKLKISTAQFENRSGDKAWNLSVIEKLTEKAAAEGSKVIAFHECSITGYTFARKLSKQQMLDLAERIPGGESIFKLQQIAEKYDMTCAGRTFRKRQ
jgi:predicted amidohydrolase